MNAYSSEKAAKHPLQVLALREGRQPFPVHVQLILSDLCNQDCCECSYRIDGSPSNQLFALEMAGERNSNPNRMIPVDKVFEIIKDCKEMGVRAIQLTGGGEPTLHPNFLAICRQIITSGMDLALVTNGVKLDDVTCAYLNMCASWVRVSIDAGTEKTYCEVRRVSPDHYRKAWDSIRKLSELQGKCHVGVGFVMMKENVSECGLCARKARDAGADSFRISAAFMPDGIAYFDGWEEDAKRESDLAIYYQTPDFAVVNSCPARIADLRQGNPDYHDCGYQNFTTYVGGDQNVYRCCNTAYNERGLIGSIKDKTFRQLWDSVEKKEDFNTFDATGCPRCQFNSANRVIAGLVAQPQSHDNFV